MTSGIYRLTFSNGQYYIGKSNNIERRWREHWTKFEKGTAAKPMQACFNQCGYPEGEVIYDVHPEHLDVIEPIAIHNHWGPDILNTTRESCCEELLERHIPYCKYSLATIFFNLEDKTNEIDKLKKEFDRKVLQLKRELKSETENFNEILDDIKSGTQLEKVERKLKANTEILVETQKRLQELESRGFFARLFNL